MNSKVSCQFDYQVSANMGGWQGLEMGKTVVLKNERGKCMDVKL